MARRRNKLIDYLQYLGLRVFAMVVHMFGLKANYRTARWISDGLWWAGKRWRKLARFEHRSREHLRRSFPGWPDEQIERVAKGSLRSFFYLGIEVLFTTRLITPRHWRRHMVLENQAENLRLMLEHQTPLIYVTGHFGNWEVVGYTMAALGFPNAAVARPLDNPYLSEYVYGIRQKRGLTILDKKGVALRADEILDANGSLSFIADQDAGRKGCFVEFFGRKASTYKSIALLAMRHGAPVLVGYGRRLAEPFRFALGIHRIIRPAEWAEKDDPMTWITQEYTSALEEVIRAAPEQYLWTHRRWKHRPKGEPDAPDGIA